MNQAMEMLRARTIALYDQIAGESNIELQIDPLDNIPCDAGCDYAQSGYHAEPTAYIHKRTEETTRMENGLMASSNYKFDPCIEHLNWTFKQQGKVKVWIYNISHEEYTLGNGVIKNLRVPACKGDELYSVVTSLPAVFITPNEKVDSGEIDYLLSDGRRIAMDVINPANLGIDQNIDMNGNWIAYTSLGTNFSKKGIFFSTHNPPLKKELRDAHKRLKAHYLDLMERANTARITDAAAALGIKRSDIEAAQQYVKGLSGNK